MKTGTIQDFRGSWGSGIATLSIKVGRKVHQVACENGSTVRALAGMFPDVIAPGHSVNVAALVGQRVRFALDEMGLMLGALAPAEDE